MAYYTIRTCAKCSKTFRRYKSNPKEDHCSKCRYRGLPTRGVDPLERLWSMVNKGGPKDCWIWTGCLTHDGYGRFWFANKTVLAHRFAYEHLVGPIPNDLTCDHLCRNRACVNPAHIELVTVKENTRRGSGNYGKTHCIRGHEFTPENTYTNRNKRQCRKCQKIHIEKYKAQAKTVRS